MASDEPLTTHDLVGSRRPDGDERQPGREDAQHRPLMAGERLDDFRGEWERIQTGFVDDPRRAVEDADALVDDLLRELSETLSREREALEAQWDRGESVDTEDLRTALQRYREFFNRLLST